jgi:hypothetical protein
VTDEGPGNKRHVCLLKISDGSLRSMGLVYFCITALVSLDLPPVLTQS